MKKTLILIIGIITGVLANAQSPKFDWVKQVGSVSHNNVKRMGIDAKGAVYIMSSLNGSADFDPGPGQFKLTCLSYYNFYILKLDASGNFLWAKLFDGSSAVINAISIAVDDKGNTYTTGYFSGTIDFDPGPDTFNLKAAGDDIFVLKLDVNGNLVWVKQMKSNSDNSGYSIKVDSKGNTYTTGRFEGAVDFDPGPGTFNLISSGGADIFILKLDAEGNLKWAKAMGGSSYNAARSITTDVDGNVYAIGDFYGLADFDPGPGVYNLQGSGGFDGTIFILKLDPQGNFLWAHNFNTIDGYEIDLASDQNGNIYATGAFKGIGDFDPGTGIFNLTSVGEIDMFILKLDAKGNFLWAKSYGASRNDYAAYIAFDSYGKFYTTGSFSGTVEFDPNSHLKLHSVLDVHNVFVLELSETGDFINAYQLASNNSMQAGSIVIDPMDNIYTTGTFSGEADFDPGDATFNLRSVSNEDIFIQKMSVKNFGQLSICPNPTKGIININLETLIQFEMRIQVINSVGQQLTDKTVSNTNIALDIKDLSPGLYFVKVMAGNVVLASEKIIKQ